MESKEYKKILAYVNQQIKVLNGLVKVLDGSSVDLSDYYTKAQVEALIPVIPTIPDELKDLLDDTTHRTVTDIEKTTWNNKSTAPNDAQKNSDILQSEIEAKTETILYWNGNDKTVSPDMTYKYIVIENNSISGTIAFNSIKPNSEITLIVNTISVGQSIELISEDYPFLLNGVEFSSIQLYPEDNYQVFKLFYYTEINKIIVLSRNPYQLTKAGIEAVLTGEISSHSHAGSSSPTAWGKYF